MIRINLAVAATVAMFAISMPAFAQSSETTMGPNNTAGKSGAASAMSTNSAMSGGTNMAASSMPTTCQGMMDKAHPMMDSMGDGNKKMMATKQMDMANTAMSSGKEKTCMRHMKTAMHDMM
jgi:hypothetical protein